MFQLFFSGRTYTGDLVIRSVQGGPVADAAEAQWAAAVLSARARVDASTFATKMRSEGFLT